MNFTDLREGGTPVKKLNKNRLSPLAVALDSEYNSDESDTSDDNRDCISESSEEETSCDDIQRNERLQFSHEEENDDLNSVVLSESSEVQSEDDDTNDVDEPRISGTARNHKNHRSKAGDNKSTKATENGIDSGHDVSSASDPAANLDGSGGSTEGRYESHEIGTDTSDGDVASFSTKANDHSDFLSGPSTSRSSSPISNPETEKLVMSLVQKEIGVGNIDPLMAQRREILICRREYVEKELAKSRMLLETANINLLPDKGEKLRRSMIENENKLAKLTEEMDSLPSVKTPRSKSKTVVNKFTDPPPTSKHSPNPVSKPDPTVVKTLPVSLPSWRGLPPPDPKSDKPLGQKALETQERQQALTEKRLKDFHGSLNARPSEDERAKDPKGLTVSLMPHQQHALAWLLWRENQRPHGGILADDMGLGKTLTMISLVIATIARDPDHSEDSDDDEPVYRGKSIRHKGGTLVVCPASVLSQWNAEITKRVKGGMLAVELFHGNSRETVPRRLAKNDVVITTYNLISREYNKGDNRSVLYDIMWKRVILDEAHIIRNRRSQASESVCHLKARNRWALTGTPIQNKELDLYALLKFLKCTPFDDLNVWRRWVDNKNAHGHQRLATVMKTLMLRRTKRELQAKGGLGALPDKNLEEIHVKLDPEEQLVYEKVLVYSRTLFAQFLHQRAEKDHMNELIAGKYDAPTFLQTPKDTQFTKVQNQLLARHADVKAHEILVLLLRLRQICCHPALIEAMLDQEDLKGNDVVDEQGLDPDFTSGLGALNLEDDENVDPNEIGVDRRVVQDLLTSQNSVFNPQRQSSKMRSVLKTIQEILDKGDKIVVVSQWTSMLEVVRTNLSSLKGATYDMLTGNVPVRSRQKIMESFNTVGSAPRILLLSLTAGGVGLNLVGGNHLLLLDIHWNPQLEAQAQDRIYRVGQKKSVYIYKFICLDTIEQRIKALQDSKLAIAQGVLTGAGTAGASKLTLDDLKSLFSL